MLKRGGLRLLTSGEIRLASELYGQSIQYHRVWVHHGSYFPFSMQEKNTAVTPNGEIWFESNLYRDDYSLSGADFKHLFMHEMMHVWQYQRGMSVKLRGLMSWAVSYEYDLDQNFLSSYSMEQQASIVSDYWLLVKHRLNTNNYRIKINYKNYDQKESIVSLTRKYEKVLTGFPR